MIAALFPGREPPRYRCWSFPACDGGESGNQRPGNIDPRRGRNVGFIAWYLMARAEKQRIRDISVQDVAEDTKICQPGYIMPPCRGIVFMEDETLGFFKKTSHLMLA